MVKRAQITFIFITMSILLAVFGAIYAGMTTLSRIAHAEIMENTIDEAFESMITSSAYPTDKIVFENGELKNSSAKESEEVARQIFNFASGNLHKTKFGSVSVIRKSFCYKFYSTKSEQNNVFIAMDMSENLLSLRKNQLNTFTLLLSIYVIIFIVVWTLSAKVFQPIKNTLEKQKRFISDASHELKTPLTIISANADVLRQNGENSQYLDNIKSQTERMDGLVADMLSLAKMDEGRLELQNEDFNVSEAVTEVVLPFDALAYEKHKELIIDISPDVVCYGDRASVKKITSILMDNAIKYSDKEIKVSLKREGGRFISLSVYNSGSTIQNDEANRIFERFYSGENSHSRKNGGSGLGLSIAKSIADANKWKIFAESEYGVSMKITVHIKIK